MSANDLTDPWTDHTSKCWPLEEHHYAEVFAVCASSKTDDPHLWIALLSPSARAAALRENRGHCLNCHEDTRSFRNCRHPFINESGCLNTKLGQLGDDDACRRWPAPPRRQVFSPAFQEKSSQSFMSNAEVPPGPRPGITSQRSPR